ncbi:cysteine-rich CWC protein [Geothermobacter ehrlichii]|uniref:Cysteine-rich CWC protein n=2 Tax=Geothermobacter ehrlichii TaxID=213224 RepID=A0A5D3WE56_9BACT|nr:cysteine-rich CWC protein [Geothermobacter ehrlichii]
MRVDPTICPICKGDNNCGLHADPGPCWCVDVEIPAALIDLVPPELKRKACICLSCIEAFREDPELFAARYCQKIDMS